MITPNSEIKLLAGVPLDPTYQHTLYWDSEAVQVRDMGNFSIGTFGKQYYQRVSKNTLRLKSNIATVYQANYMMFKNAAEVLPATIPPTAYSGYPDKWFYAFVLNVEYVNEQVVEITYEIDVIQTWFFEIKESLKPCFIERQHTTTDKIGDNIIEEPVGAPEFLYEEVALQQKSHAVFTSENMKPNIIICSTFKKVNGEWDFSPGGMQGGMYTGVNTTVFTSAADANTFINDATDEMKSEGIVSAYMLPKVFCPAPVTGQALDVIRYNDCHIQKYQTVWKTNPRNNKLYTAPYYSLYVLANDGRSAEYRLEDFENQLNSENCYFDLICVPSAKPEIALLPKNYKIKESETGNESYNDIFIMNDIPYCAFAIDSFKAWIAQNKIKIGGDLLSTAVGAGAAIGMAAIPGVNIVASSLMIAGAASSATKSAIGMVSDIVTAAKMPPHLSGQQSSSIMMATESLKYRFYYAYVKDEYMQVIDDFFTMYGYAIKRVAVPNLKARSRWTYIKTNGFNIRTQKNQDDAGTSIPAQDIVKIKAVFDNGVTFWAQPSYVGNYEAHNGIIT